MDEGKTGLSTTEELSSVKSVKELDAEKGFTLQQDDSPMEIPNIKLIGKNEIAVEDGKW